MVMGSFICVDELSDQTQVGGINICVLSSCMFHAVFIQRSQMITVGLNRINSTKLDMQQLVTLELIFWSVGNTIKRLELLFGFTK